MSRYTDEELRAKAIVILRHKEKHPKIYRYFLEMLRAVTGEPIPTLEKKIQEFKDKEI